MTTPTDIRRTEFRTLAAGLPRWFFGAGGGQVEDTDRVPGRQRCRVRLFGHSAGEGGRDDE